MPHCFLPRWWTTRRRAIRRPPVVLAEHKIDLLVAPSNGVAPRVDSINGTRFSGSFSSLPAVAGYPHLSVPMGQLKSLPLGISFIGAPWSEDVLLATGYALEQRAKARVVPKFIPSVEAQEQAFAPAVPSPWTGELHFPAWAN